MILVRNEEGFKADTHLVSIEYEYEYEYYPILYTRFS